MFGLLSGNLQNQADATLSGEHGGGWCFWSPELPGTCHPRR
jgi:hypothetical protein